MKRKDNQSTARSMQSNDRGNQQHRMIQRQRDLPQCIHNWINLVQVLIDQNYGAQNFSSQFGQDWKSKQVMSIDCFQIIIRFTYKYSLKKQNQRKKDLQFKKKSEQTIISQLLSVLLKNIQNASQNKLIEKNLLKKYEQCCKTICKKLFMQKYKLDYVVTFCDNVLSKFALCSQKYIQEKNIFKSVWEKEYLNHSATYSTLLLTLKQYIQPQKQYQKYLRNIYKQECQLHQYVTQIIIILQQIIKSYQDCQVQEEYESERQLCLYLIDKAKEKFIIRCTSIKSESWKYLFDYKYPFCDGVLEIYALCQEHMEQTKLEL